MITTNIFNGFAQILYIKRNILQAAFVSKIDDIKFIVFSLLHKIAHRQGFGMIDLSVFIAFSIL